MFPPQTSFLISTLLADAGRDMLTNRRESGRVRENACGCDARCRHKSFGPWSEHIAARMQLSAGMHIHADRRASKKAIYSRYTPQNLREDGGVDSYSNSLALSRARDVRYDAE